MKAPPPPPSPARPGEGEDTLALPPHEVARVEAAILASTRVTTSPLVPEVRLRLADEVIAPWAAVEAALGRQVGAAFWAFAWPGSQALARHVLDRPELVRGRSVLDFASGCGLAGLAALRAGAASALAADIDPVAEVAARLNAALDGAALEVTTRDLVGGPLPGVEVVLAGDVCYERSVSARIVAWLRELARGGALVLLADPGRAFTPQDGLEAVARHRVPTSRELERDDVKDATVWRLLG